jgi:hypothetical protein
MKEAVLMTVNGHLVNNLAVASGYQAETAKTSWRAPHIHWGRARSSDYLHAEKPCCRIAG